MKRKLKKTRASRPNWYEIKAEGETAEIMIYDFIGEDFFGQGVSAKGFVNELKALGGVNTINLRINSPGGSVVDGTAIFNSLKQHPAMIRAHIDGLAASMASLIAMAGDEIIIAANSLFMIHNPHGLAIGEAAEMRKVADLLDKIKTNMVASYAERTGQTESDISALMDAETWFNGEEAVEAGFADSLAEPVKVAANFDLSEFKNAPDYARGIAGVYVGPAPEPAGESPAVELEIQGTLDSEQAAELMAAPDPAKEETEEDEQICSRLRLKIMETVSEET